MSEDQEQIEDTYRALILSLNIESNDMNIIKQELHQRLENIPFIFMYLTSLISNQIKLLSPTYNDTIFFLKLIKLFRLIRADFNDVTYLLSKDNCVNLTSIGLEKLNCCAIQDKGLYNHIVILGLIDLIQELLIIYPKEVSNKISNNILFHAILNTFFEYSTIRFFIYHLVPLKTDFFSTLQVNIGIIFSHITKELPNTKDNDILNELIIIANIFSKEFKGIYNDFYSILNQLVYCGNIQEDSQSFKLFFKSLFDLVFKDNKGYCFIIVNLMLQLYEEHIHEKGISRLIILSIFSHIQIQQYYLISENSDIVSKFINQLYKSTDTHLIIYFFKWLDINLRIQLDNSNNNNDSNNNIIIHKQIPLSREFKAFGRIIFLFKNNTQMLECLCNQLKLIFAFQKDFLILFLDQNELYQGIYSIMKSNTPDASMLFIFIRDLLKIYMNDNIFQKVTQSNLLQFDLCSNDQFVYDKIYISLEYENNQDKFNTKCDKIMEKLTNLSFEIQNRRDCFDDNVNKFIEIFSILLQFFLYEKNKKITPITVKLFKNITDLLLDFSIVLFKYEVELKYVFKLWNKVFQFIYNFNLTLLTNKFKDDSNRNGNDNVNISNQICSLEVPMIIFKNHIQQFIYEGLSKLNNVNTIMLLRYLYNKCINYKSTEYEFNYSELMLDPVELIKSKYFFPQSFNQSSEKRFSILFLESQMLLKCIMKVILLMDNLNNTLSLLSFLSFLCEINSINSSIMLHCSIVKFLLKLLDKSKVINEKVYLLLENLILHFNKNDMELYLKQIYILLIKNNNMVISHNLLKSIYENIEKSILIRNHITLTSINSNNSQVYQILYMSEAVDFNYINILFSLCTPSFQDLNKFYLCDFSNSTFRFSIVFEKDNINCYLNKKLKHSFQSFTKELNKNIKITQSQINKTTKWYNFIIQTGNQFNLQIDQTIITLNIRDTIFTENIPLAQLNLSIGYLNCGNNENNEEQSLNYFESIPYVDISYLLLMKENIPISLVLEIEKTQINYSKGKSITQIKSLIEKDTQAEFKDIITEILFNTINLENTINIPLKKRKTMYNMLDHNSIKDKDYIPYISCNNGSKKDNRLYLLKLNSVLELASMNRIYNQGSLTKSYLEKKFYSFYDNLDLTLNNIFFADIFYSYLIQMNNQLFSKSYYIIINIILKVRSLRKLFFNKYLNSLPFVFISNASVLNKEFVTCLLMNPEIPLGTIFVGQCIKVIYLNPHLFPLLSKDIQLFFFDKFYIFFHSSDITDSSTECKLFFKLIKKLINLLLHIELNIEIAEVIKEKIKEIIDLFFNNEKAKANELEILSTQCCHYLSVISSHCKFRDKDKGINIDNLQFLTSQKIIEQMNIISPLLTANIDESNDTSIISEDDSFLIDNFKLEFKIFKESLHYTKLIQKSNKMLRLVWPELFDNYTDYTWGLSSKEGYCRMRKKMVLKENDMNITDVILDKKIASYEKFWIWLEKMALYELYSSSSLIKNMISSHDRYQNSYICLLIKNNIKTESLLILGDKTLYIILNVIVDNNKKFHLSKEKTSNLFWARDDNEKEWEKIISTNKNKRDSVNRFNYNSTQIKIKAIRYLKISELHKKKHLHQKNSIEIFTLNGLSYFITVFPKYRNEIFSKILKNIDDQSENSKIKNIQKASGSIVIYLKHYPLLTMRSKRRKKADVQREKTVIENTALANELQEKWSQYHFISNFSYLMIINTLSGRSYNDLTQYFIFPWILKDFFTEKMNPSINDFYRDFLYPLHAQNKNEREYLKKKYEMKIAEEKMEREKYDKNIAERKKKGEKIGKDEKYTPFPKHHSGNFYSNYSFVCYYMFRINPFTSIAYSVYGTFNQGDRCFNCLSFFSSIKDKYQEWVPELFYFPELLVNINNHQLGTMTVNNEKKNVNDASIPPWSDMDPRIISIVFNNIFEGPKVSQMLNNWIDLVFGYKLTGKECIDSLNLFSEACYPYEDLKKKRYRNRELRDLLFETENMGCCPIQLFNKAHLHKKINTNSTTTTSNSYPCFYEKKTFIASINYKSNIIKCDIISKSIGDFRAKYELPRYNTSNGEGGLSSLHQYIDKTHQDDLDEEIKQKRTYYAVGKNKSLIGPKFNLILSHSQSSLYITIPKNSIVFEYNLHESSSINKVISSINGKYIIVGLSNGTVIKYRKKTRHKDTIPFPPTDILKQKRIKNVFKNSIRDHCHSKPINCKYIYYHNTSIKDFDFWRSVTSIPKNKPGVIKQYYLLEEARTGIPINTIIKMDLCESYSFLLIIDQLNYIYQYEFNKMKLLYRFKLKTVAKNNYPIKYAKIIHKTGDYVIGTKYSLHLFTINGLPLAEMNIFDILKPCFPITSIEAVAIYDTILFTGHSNGEVKIWRLKTDLYTPTSSENDFPLFRTFHQRYQNSFKEKMYSFGIQKRELDEIKSFLETKSKIIMLKLTDEGSRLYFIDQDKKIFRLGSDEYIKNKLIKPKAFNVTNANTNFNIQYSSKSICKLCKKVCEDTCSSFNLSRLCTECSHLNSNSSLSDRLIFDI